MKIQSSAEKGDVCKIKIPSNFRIPIKGNQLLASCGNNAALFGEVINENEIKIMLYIDIGITLNYSGYPIIILPLE